MRRGILTQFLISDSVPLNTTGGLAQLGERLAGSQKVIGSSPLSSIRNGRMFSHVAVSFCTDLGYDNCHFNLASQCVLHARQYSAGFRADSLAARIPRMRLTLAQRIPFQRTTRCAALLLLHLHGSSGRVVVAE